MRIYTRTGDSGETALFGGQRVSKSALRVEAYGELDELNACLGLAVAARADAPTANLLIEIQRHLFALSARIADAPIHAETARLKEERTALGVETIMKLAELTPSALLSLGARSASGPINTIVTNVPGPQFPLCLQGARLLELYPQVPLLEGLGIGIALASYDGFVHWGFNSDPDVAPDANVFIEQIRAAYVRVAAAVQGAAVPPPAAPEKRKQPARRTRAAKVTNGGVAGATQQGGI